MLKDKRSRAAIISVAVNIVLVILKLWGASLSGSLGLRADALHSLSDVGVSLLVLLSVFFARKTSKWKQGIEEGTAFTIAVIIISVGVSILLYSRPDPGDAVLQQLPLAVLLTWICIMISWFVAQYKMRVGRECGALNLQADGYHSKMDVYSSVAVLAGLLGNWSGLNLDGVASLVVGLLILRIGFVVLAGAIRSAWKGDIAVADAMEAFEGAHTRETVMGFIRDRFPQAGSRIGCFAAYLAHFQQHKKKLAAVAVIALLLGWAASGVAVLGPDEAGLETRFGQLRGKTLGPGLHYHLPAPFGRIYRASPGRVHQLEFGFRTVGARGITTEPDAYLWESRHMSGIYEKRTEESILLTGDKNEIDLNFTIEYTMLQDGLAHWFFTTSEPEKLIRNFTQRCAQRVMGAMALPEALTTNRDAIENSIAGLLQPELDKYGIGVRVTAVLLQDVHPPADVVSAFRAVATAREEKATLIHEAEAYRNETLPAAEGSAVFLLRDAEAYNAEKRFESEGGAAWFSAMAATYRDHPAAAQFVQYITALEEVLAGTRNIVLPDALTREKGVLPQYFMTTEFLKWPALEDRRPERAPSRNTEQRRAETTDEAEGEEWEGS
jgi:modulator of FtsH protease HflK